MEHGGIDARVLVNGIEATVADGTFLVMDLPLVRGPNLIEAVATDAVGNVGRHSITVNFQDQAGVRIGVASGNGQAELVNQVLPQSLVVDVKDALGNPVAGRIVTFEVSRNSGLLKANASGPGKRVVQIPSNGSGQASVLFQLGDTAGEGNNRVIATALGGGGRGAILCLFLGRGAGQDPHGHGRQPTRRGGPSPGPTLRGFGSGYGRQSHQGDPGDIHYRQR